MITAQDRLNQILPTWYSLLTQWSLDGSLVAAATDALVLDGTNAKEGSQDLLQSYLSQWSAGNFNSLPQIVLLSAEDISGAYGAYADSTDTIYLNQDWLLGASAEDIWKVLTEELGHYLDDQLNQVDTQGDEGEYFASKLFAFSSIDDKSISLISTDDDFVVISVGGESITAQASSNGIVDKFLSLNAATRDYVSSDGLYIPQSGDFTVSVWARATSLISGQNIQILSQGTSGDNGFYIGYNPYGFIRVGDSWGGWSANGIGVPFPTDGRWHCYQVVKKGSIGYLYIDGVKVGTTETYDNPRGVVGFQNPIGGDALLIGKQFTGFGEYWDGGIDDVTIFSESLSEAELSAVRNGNTIASIPAFRSDFNSSLTFTGSGATSLLAPSGSPELLPLTDAGEKLISVSAGNDSGLSVAFQADGKFVIGGLGNNNTSIAAVRLLSAGAEDVQFGSGGSSVLSLSGSSTSSTSFSSDCIAIQSDGKILLGTSANYDFRIYRINADGTQDLAFGNTGSVNFDFFGGSDSLSDIISLPSGKILLVGFTGNSNGVVRIVRLNQDGSVDNSYGTNGIVSSDGNRYASSAALQADGKLLVAGNDDGHTFFSRFNTDGSLDTTLNASSASPGSVFTSRGYISLFGDITVQSDGKIVAAGYYAPDETRGQPISGRNYQLMVVRTNPDGSYDSSFGISGVATIPVSLYNDRARSVVLQADGKILISGSSDTNGTDSLNVFTIVRLNTDGSLDTSFASNGILKVDVDEGSDSVGDMCVDESGRITIVGTSYSGKLQKTVISVIRVDQYGNLDKSFPSSISGDSSVADFSLANSLIISGSGTGTLDGVTFSDVFAFNLGGRDDIITINESAGTSIQMTVEGGDGNDTLNGNSLKNKLVLTGINQGSLDGIQFSGIENINLGSGNDEVYIMSGGMLTGLLNGGSGGTVTVVPPGGDIGDYDGGGGGGDGYVDSGGNPVTTDPGPTTPDPIEFNPPPQGFKFNGGLNSIFMNDAVNIASINGPGYGVVDGTDFLNFYALDLKGNDDVATINPLGYLFGKLSGGDGSDTLNLSANSNVLSIDQALVGDVDRTDFESFEIINLLAGDDSVSVNINALPPGSSDPRKSLTLNGGDGTDQLTLKITREEVRYLESQGTFDELQAYLANPTGTTITIALSSIDLTLTGFENTGFFNSSPNQIAITSTQFDENLAVGSVVASLSAVDPDQVDGLSFHFVNQNGQSSLQSGIFNLDGNKVKLASVPDFEAKASYGITIRVSDDYGASFDKDIIIVVGDVNEAPTAVALTNKVASLAENTATTSRIKVADIQITDDALGTNAVTLSGADAALFEADAGVLYLKAGAVLDFETNPSLDVTVSVADSTVAGSLPVTATYALAVTDVNEAPTAVILANKVASLAENTATTSRIKVADIQITDDALGTNAVTLSGADAALFEADAGVLYLKAGAVLDFETNPSLDVTVSVADSTVAGSLPVTATYALAVTDVNEAPSDVIPPTVTSIAVEGTAVILTFSETVSAESVPTTAFSVQTVSSKNVISSREVTAVTLNQNDPRQVILTLSGTAPASNVNLRVSYTDPTGLQTTGVVQDVNGNDLASFSNIFANTFKTSSTTTLASQYSNLILAGSLNINGTGNSLNNTIIGNGSNNTLSGLVGNDIIKGEDGTDILIGGTGGDLLTGGGGNDTFRFVLTDSLLANYDKITDFAIGADRIDGPTAITAANVKDGNGSINGVGLVQALDATTIGNLLNSNSNFAANGASVFTYNDPTVGLRTFVALNNNTATFSASSDAIIEITGYSGFLSNLAIV